MSDDEPVPETKLTSTKRRWAADGKFLTGRIARSETDRLPPGQHLVRDWPVLDLGQQPHIALDASGSATATTCAVIPGARNAIPTFWLRFLMIQSTVEDSIRRVDARDAS